MSCSVSKEELIAYLYDELEEEKSGVFKQHIRTCPDCRKEIASLTKERDILKKWQIKVPEMEFIFVEEKQSLLSRFKEYFLSKPLRPVKIGYVLAGGFAFMLFFLSLLNLEFNYDESGISMSMGIFEKKHSIDVGFIEALSQNQQETINMILQIVAASEMNMKQERNIILTQLIEDFKIQRKADMQYIGQNFTDFGFVTTEKFRQNDELIKRLVFITEGTLLK